MFPRNPLKLLRIVQDMGKLPSSVLPSKRQGEKFACHWVLILQNRYISFIGRGPLSTAAPPLSSSSAEIPTSTVEASHAGDLELIKQLELGSVKDFNLLDFLWGNSLVNEYDLFSWWSPASWFRVVLEYVHFNIDLPWWSTVMCTTASLRFLMLFVPIASHRLMGRVQLYKQEIDEYKKKIESAQKSGNFLLTMQAQMELKDFLKAKDIKLYRQFLIMSLNASIFMTQFVAVKKLADVAFPGLSTGGLFWFKDLTVPDPYYCLPLISAITIAAVFKLGAETGGTNQGINPQLMKILTRMGPIMVFACSTRVSSAISLYWCTSNVISLLFSGLFKFSVVRTFLKIPQLPAKQIQPYEKVLGRDISQIRMNLPTVSTATATLLRSSCVHLPVVVGARHASTARDIFVPAQDALMNIPDIPIIVVPSEVAASSGFRFYEHWLLKLDILDVLGVSNSSIVNKMGIFSWYSPASWYRIGLEFAHNCFDLPWFASIICVTICLRLLLLRGTLFLQRFTSKKILHDETLKMFAEKKKEAREVIRSEALYRKISHDENIYIDTYNLRSSNRYYYLGLNSIVFLSQYQGITLMAKKNFPGWNTGGALSFLDLTATDPYFLVPALSALLIGCTLSLGYDPTGVASANKYVKAFKYVVLPAGVFFFSSRVPVAVSVYWCSSNLFNLVLTTFLRLPKVRYALDFPVNMTQPSSASFQKAWKRAFGWKQEKEKLARSRPVLWEVIQRRDLDRFAKASKVVVPKDD
ncbi:unnamed protein product [Thelazia callipaeda]|uniref:Mitochondrial inner membrane protein OXA1L n=1 Tax=Thelazia callipaeda TaxID=103827 RepID=A0A0N5CWA2_THECL|nr:unnamed protein product [Thelazia callipaeda]